MKICVRKSNLSLFVLGSKRTLQILKTGDLRVFLIIFIENDNTVEKTGKTSSERKKILYGESY
jgi:hypothetical protein